jgi:hypothetical protein
MPDNPTPHAPAGDSPLTPETRKLLGELYGTWWQSNVDRGFMIPFIEWLEYTAGNCWLEAPRDNTQPAP